MESPAPKPWPRRLGLSFLLFTTILFVAIIAWWPISLYAVLGGAYIGNLPSGQAYDSTTFEFRFGDETRFVADPGNHLQWVFGELPDSIGVDGRNRRIVYNEPKAIIKSRRDSLDVQNDSVKHKGWMGIWDHGTHFFVDADGVVQQSKPALIDPDRH
jgi:hypothetical protein